MLTDDDTDRFRSEPPVDTSAAIAQVPVNEFNLARLFRHYYSTNDPVTRRWLSEAARPSMRAAIDHFT
jgi:hypothetical protein